MEQQPKQGAQAGSRTRQKPPFPTPPETIVDRKRGKQYVRQEVLGEGGFARCYAVSEVGTGVRYAAKIIPKASLKSSKQKAKLFGEINIHKSVSHKYIVKWWNVFEDDDYVYMLLELCQGKTFVEMLKKRKTLTEAEVRYFMWQLLDAVAYMHKTKVIHRDLKLGNIFLTADLEVKIGDFGLAAKIQKDGERKRTICGTPNYIAPEVLFDTQNGHSYEVDIWSLGVIMYTLLVGKPPFQTKDVKAIYKRIRDNNYEFPEGVILSEEAVSLITGLLHQNPGRFPPSLIHPVECRPMAEDIMKHEFFKVKKIVDSIPRTALHTNPAIVEEDASANDEFATPPLSQSSSKSDGLSSPGTAIASQRVLSPTPAVPLSLPSDSQEHRSIGPSPRQTGRNLMARPEMEDLVKRASLLRVSTNSGDAVPRTTHSRAPIPEIWKQSAKIGGESGTVGNPVSTSGNNDRKSYGSSSSSPAVPLENKENAPSRLAIQPKTMSLDKRDSYSSPKGAVYGGKKPSDTFSPAPVQLSGSQALEYMCRTLRNALEQHKSGAIPTLSEEESQTAYEKALYEHPKLFITKWIDYCNKYGLGYQLLDGSVGVYFNDSTTIILAGDNVHFEYLFHDRSTAALSAGVPRSSSSIVRKEYTMTNFPVELSKKVTLLKHFKGYMQNNGSSNSSGKRSSSSSLAASPSDTEKDGPTSNLIFLTKFIRSRFGAVFRLSNHVVQFNLHDHTKLILSDNGQRVTYMNKKRVLVTKPLLEALSMPGVTGREMTDRIKYAKEVLSQMILRSMNARKNQAGAPSRTAEA